MFRVCTTHSQEGGTSSLILLNPARGKGAILDLFEHLTHLFTNTLINQARAADIVAIFGSITNRVAHITHATLVYQVHNQLYLVQAFEVGNLRLITSLN